MRGAAVLVLAAASCATRWVPDERDGVVREALGAPGKSWAVLAATDRVYHLLDGALQDEIAAVAGALAAAAWEEEMLREPLPDRFPGPKLEYSWPSCGPRDGQAPAAAPPSTAARASASI